MNLKKINPSIVQYKYTIIIIIILIFSLYIAYISSKSYKLSQIMFEMESLDSYMTITSELNIHKELKLCDFYIASAFRPYVGKNQYFQYTDLSITQKIIESGARSIYVDVFNDSMGVDANPVLSTGIRKGQWKLSLNTIPFEDLCKLISTICFNAGYVNNYDDPFILMLNLHVNGNINCLNKIRDNIYKYFRRYILSNKYTYGKVNMSQVQMKFLKQKLLIFSSGGYEHSKLEEFINQSWNKDGLKKISYEALYPNIEYSEVIKVDGNALKNYNKNNMSIITPTETFNINNIATKNYDGHNFWLTGCQFVCINYQLIDTDLSTYITKFRYNSFIPKEETLRGAPVDTRPDIPENKGTNSADIDSLPVKENNGQFCPEMPSEDYTGGSNMITYNDLCFITNKGDDCNCKTEKEGGDASCVNNDLYEEKPFYINTKSEETGITDPVSKIAITKNVYDNSINNYQLCCSKERVNDPFINNNKHFITYSDSNTTLPVSLLDGNDNFDKVGNKNTLNLISLTKDTNDAQNENIIKSKEDLEKSHMCLINIDGVDCPPGWNKEATTTYGYNICCRNP